MHRAAEHAGQRMSHITALAAGALLVLAPVLAGCGPSPAPTPTPTAAFASEEEAFAEAEKVYRAYNEAGNDDRSGRTKNSAIGYLTGIALEDDLHMARSVEEQGLRLEGEAEVASVQRHSVDLQKRPAEIEIDVCLDITGTSVRDASGNDVTPTERQERLAIRVSLVVEAPRLLISDLVLLSEEPC